MNADGLSLATLPTSCQQMLSFILGVVIFIVLVIERINCQADATAGLKIRLALTILFVQLKASSSSSSATSPEKGDLSTAVQFQA